MNDSLDQMEHGDWDLGDGEDQAAPAPAPIQQQPKPQAPTQPKTSRPALASIPIPTKAAVNEDAAVKDALAELDKARAEFIADLEPVKHHFDAARNIEATKRVLATSNDLAEVTEAGKLLSELSGPGAAETRAAIIRIKRQGLQPLRDAADRLVSAALERVTALKAAALEYEKAFFAEHNLPHEQTAVSRRLEIWHSELRSFANGLRAPTPAGPASQLPPSGDEFAAIRSWFE
jgi:hypothetical protein